MDEDLQYLLNLPKEPRSLETVEGYADGDKRLMLGVLSRTTEIGPLKILSVGKDGISYQYGACGCIHRGTLKDFLKVAAKKQTTCPECLKTENSAAPNDWYDNCDEAANALKLMSARK